MAAEQTEDSREADEEEDEAEAAAGSEAAGTAVAAAAGAGADIDANVRRMAVVDANEEDSGCNDEREARPRGNEQQTEAGSTAAARGTIRREGS